MQGRAYRRRGNRWSYMFDVGFDAATGKRRQHGRSGFATKAEAEKALRDLLTSIEHGTYVQSTPTTVKEYLDGWLQTSKARSETMWRSYALSVKRVNSHAERLGLVPRNAGHAAKGPIAQRADMVTWTSEELAAFLDHVRSDRLYAA
jgi:Arm DNA-binding domain